MREEKEEKVGEKVETKQVEERGRTQEDGRGG